MWRGRLTRDHSNSDIDCDIKQCDIITATNKNEIPHMMTSKKLASSHKCGYNLRTVALVGHPSQIPVIASSSNVKSKSIFSGEYLKHEGGYYRWFRSKNDHSMYRCSYRSGDTTAATASAVDGGWTFHKDAREKSLGRAKVHRCPGVQIVNH